MTELVNFVTNMKQNMSVQEICSKAPKQIGACLQHIRDLTFEGEPNYDHMRKLINECATQYNFSLMDNVYDWSILLHSRIESKKLRTRDEDGFRICY